MMEHIDSINVELKILIEDYGYSIDQAIEILKLIEIKYISEALWEDGYSLTELLNK